MSESINAAIEQPMPVGEGQTVIDLVKADLDARAAKDLQTYGTLLRVNNGRDADLDLYQELLDAVMYLRQSMAEKRDLKAEIGHLKMLLACYLGVLPPTYVALVLNTTVDGVKEQARAAVAGFKAVEFLHD